MSTLIKATVRLAGDFHEIFDLVCMSAKVFISTHSRYPPREYQADKMPIRSFESLYVDADELFMEDAVAMFPAGLFRYA